MSHEYLKILQTIVIIFKFKFISTSNCFNIFAEHGCQLSYVLIVMGNPQAFVLCPSVICEAQKTTFIMETSSVPKGCELNYVLDCCRKSPHPFVYMSKHILQLTQKIFSNCWSFFKCSKSSEYIETWQSYISYLQIRAPAMVEGDGGGEKFCTICTIKLL